MIKKYSDKLKSVFIIQAVYFVVLVACDQLIKYWVVLTLKDNEPAVLIKDAVEFVYLENRGAAFGMLQNMQWFFYIITAVVVAAIVYLVVRVYNKLRAYLNNSLSDESIFKKKTYKDAVFFSFVLATLCGGAIGNFIDRVFKGYVVDYIYFKIINYPVFNFADICVSVSAVILIVFFIFVYKDDKNLQLFGKAKEK